MPNLDLNQYRWIVPLTLFLLALLQLLYLAVLSRVPQEREVRQPSAPIMPPLRDYAPSTSDFRSPPATVQNTPSIPAPPVIPSTVVQQPPRTVPPVPIASAPTSATYASPQAQPATPRPTSTGSVGKLIVLTGLDGIGEISLPAKEFAIGRFYSPENDILVGMDEKSISRKHARFIADEAIREYYVKDTSSSFGTFVLVNGQFEQLTANAQERVYNEDVVRFGNVVTVRLLLPCETRSAVTSL